MFSVRLIVRLNLSCKVECEVEFEPSVQGTEFLHAPASDLDQAPEAGNRFLAMFGRNTKSSGRFPGSRGKLPEASIMNDR